SRPDVRVVTPPAGAGASRRCRLNTKLPGSLLLIALLGAASSALAADPSPDAARIARILKATPLIDGHNDLPWELRDRLKNDLSRFDFAGDTSKLPAPEGGAPLMTDIPRLRAGGVGAQFWSVWIPVELKGPPAVRATL